MKKSTRHKRARGTVPGARPLPAATSVASDTLVLLPVAPTSVHVYWQLAASEPQAEAGARQLRLRFYDRSATPPSSGTEPADFAPTAGSGKCYVTLAPDRVYEAEAGWVDGQGNFQRIARSNRVKTLRLATAEVVEERGAELLTADTKPPSGSGRREEVRLEGGELPELQAPDTAANLFPCGSEFPQAPSGWADELRWAAIVAELQGQGGATTRPASAQPAPPSSPPEWRHCLARLAAANPDGGWARVREIVLRGGRASSRSCSGADDWTTICERKFQSGISSRP